MDTVAAIIGAVVSLFLGARSFVDRGRAQVVGINAGIFSRIDTFTGYTAPERTLIVEVACQEDLEVALLGFEIERPGLDCFG